MWLKRLSGGQVLSVVFLMALLAGCNRPTGRAVVTPTLAGDLVNAIPVLAGTPPSFATLPPLPMPTLVDVPPQPVMTQPVIEVPGPAPTIAPLIAPTATSLPTAVPVYSEPQLQPACLVGNWQVSDLNQAMASSYAQSGATLQLQGVQGQANYAFDANGGMRLTLQNLAATFTGQVENRAVTVVQGLDGAGTARYQVDLTASQVVLSDFGGEGLLVTLDINNQRLAEGNLPVWQAFTSSLAGQDPNASVAVTYSRAAVTCSGDEMTLQSVEPLPGPLVRLSRVP